MGSLGFRHQPVWADGNIERHASHCRLPFDEWISPLGGMNFGLL